MSNVLKDFPNKFTKNQIIGKYFNQTLAKYLSVSKLNGVGKDVYNSKDEFSR